MARSGSFLGPSEIFGVPLSVVHPPDNNVAGSQFHPLLRDPALGLDDERMREMQKEIMGLLSVLQITRDLPQ